LSRLRILTLFAALIALTAFAACGGSSSSSSDPQAVVEDATLQGIESGKIYLAGEIDLKGPKGGHLAFKLTGPFQSEAEAELPEVDLRMMVKGSIDGENVDFRGGITLLGHKAYVSYEGVEYEVDPTTLDFVKSMLKRQSRSGPSEATACQEAAGGLKLDSFVEDLREGGSTSAAGTSITAVSGKLDVPGAIDALIQLSEDPACSEQLSAAGAVPSTAELDSAKKTLTDAVRSTAVEIDVGDDHIVRRIVVQAPNIVLPRGTDEGAGVEGIGFEITLYLTGVNEDQAISAPKASKPLNDLFLKLGVNPIELLNAFEGQGGGIGGLLEGLKGLGGSSGGGGSGSSGGGGQQAYYKCLGEAETPVDLQNCTGLLQ
jgi:hypothetical protein